MISLLSFTNTFLQTPVFNPPTSPADRLHISDPASASELSITNHKNVLEAHEECVSLVVGIAQLPLTRTSELKETHLAPLANTFSRSASTSTITPESTTPRPSSTGPGNGTTDAKDPNHIGMSSWKSLRRFCSPRNTAYSEANATLPPPPLKPGILIVTLHEGRGFSLPPEAEQQFKAAQHAGSVSSGSGFSIAGSIRPNSASRNQAVAGSFAPSGRPASTSGAINQVPMSHGRVQSRYLPYALVDFDKQQVFINAVSGTPQDPFWAGPSTQYKFDVSRTTDINISLYIRNPASTNPGRNDDIFIGTLAVVPRFEEVQLQADNSHLSKKDREKAAAARAEERALGQVGEEWIDVKYGSGQMKVGVQFVENRSTSLKIEDFELLKVVGKGSFGKVMQVQ